MSQVERRAWEREPTEFLGVMCETSFDDGVRVRGLVTDCSMTGARIGAPLPDGRLGARADLLFLFETNEKVRYHATVIHVDDQRGYFGVRFDSDHARW